MALTGNAAGAEFPVGGGRPVGLDVGFYLDTTLVTGLPNDSEICQDELFAADYVTRIDTAKSLLA